MHDLRNRVALVTGGAQGLGEALCRTLGEAHAKVTIADIREDEAQTLAEKLRPEGVEAMAIRMDVGDAAEAEAGIQCVMNQFGRLDILINNAGTDVTVSIEELTVAQWDRILMTNLRGPFLLSKLTLPVMREQRSGHIVNIASTAAKRTWANASAYHASKWGLLGFSHALHVEGRAHGVKVTAVISGGMRTPFLLERFPDIDPGILQDPKNVAEAVRCLLALPAETVIPEMIVLPMTETSWP